MPDYPGQKWKLSKPQADKAKEYLLAQGGTEDSELSGKYEVWRVRFSGAIFTHYTSGTLFSTGTRDASVVNSWEFIGSLIGSRFRSSAKEFLVGMDEAGKGELVGHIVLVGAVLPSECYDEIEKIIGVADTKKKHTMSYWDGLLSRLDGFREKGFRSYIEKIPPADLDKSNLNRIMDAGYQRILSALSYNHELKKCRIVIDDYGVGASLKAFLDSMSKSGAEIVVVTSADDNYLEAKVASVIAKRERESIVEKINETEEFIIDGKKVGSGNAGNPKTIEWLRAWKKTGKEWPWFIKRSFKTIRDMGNESTTEISQEKRS